METNLFDIEMIYLIEIFMKYIENSETGIHRRTQE